MTEIKIKEHDLHAIVKDLMGAALSISRPNQGMICEFIINLVENGGNKAKAAFDAGYGPKKTKDGRICTMEERMHFASTESARLLGNAGISTLYEKLLSHRYLSHIFTKSFNKEDSISIFYQLSMMNIEKNPRQAIMALKEAATLAGHYEISDQAPLGIQRGQQELLSRTEKVIIQIAESIDRTKEAPHPVNVSDVYN